MFSAKLPHLAQEALAIDDPSRTPAQGHRSSGESPEIIHFRRVVLRVMIG
jgi:hypothetical protein